MCLTNIIYFTVPLFSSRSQMASKCGKIKKAALQPQASVSMVFFLSHFDVFCDLLLKRRTATWNRLVLYNEQNEKTSNVLRNAWPFEDLCQFSRCKNFKLSATFHLCFFFSSLSYLHTVSPKRFSTPSLTQNKTQKCNSKPWISRYTNTNLWKINSYMNKPSKHFW